MCGNPLPSVPKIKRFLFLRSCWNSDAPLLSGESRKVDSINFEDSFITFANESKTTILTMLWYPAEDRITFGDQGSTEFGDNQISLTLIAAQLRIMVPRLPGS